MASVYLVCLALTRGHAAVQALLNVLSALAGEPGAAISGDESPAPVPKLVIIDAFSAVVSPILGRMQQMQGAWWLTTGPADRQRLHRQHQFRSECASLSG